MQLLKLQPPLSSPRRLALFGLLSLCAIAAGTAQAQEAQHSDLRVNVQGLLSDQGQVVVNLFQEGDDVFGTPRLKQTEPIVDRKATLTFANLANGKYALIVFHDVNGNNHLDHNVLRLPTEPLGFSNGFELTLFSGMPNAHKLAFAVGPVRKTIDIAVR